MYSAAFVPGFEHFDNEYIALWEVTLDPLSGCRICFDIVKSNRDNKPVTD
jgi:hypothetical protein